MKKIYLFFVIVVATVLIGCKSLPKKDDPNFMGDFPAQELGTIMAGTVKRFKTEIKPAQFKFVFYPRSNKLSIHHKFLGDNIWIYLTEENRDSITNDIKAYLDAYKNKALTVENNKEKAHFGNTKIFVSWGLFGAARDAMPNLRSEYQLLTENRPYFILGNSSAKSKDGANCPAMRMAFSPAQCEELLQVMDQKNLVKIVEELKKEFEQYDTKTTNPTKEDKEEKQQINYDENF